MVRKIKRMIRHGWSDLKCGILNLVVWFPIIWKDRNWDYFYILEILHKKLSLMEHFIREDGIHINNKEDADKIKLCVVLIDRLLKDEYYENVFKHHHEKWGSLRFKTTQCKDNEKLYSVDIISENVKTDEDKEQERKEFKCLSHKPEEMKTQDINCLFNMMAKHIRSWWD